MPAILSDLAVTCHCCEWQWRLGSPTSATDPALPENLWDFTPTSSGWESICALNSSLTPEASWAGGRVVNSVSVLHTPLRNRSKPPHLNQKWGFYKINFLQTPLEPWRKFSVVFICVLLESNGYCLKSSTALSSPLTREEWFCLSSLHGHASRSALTSGFGEQSGITLVLEISRILGTFWTLLCCLVP